MIILSLKYMGVVTVEIVEHAHMKDGGVIQTFGGKYFTNI